MSTAPGMRGPWKMQGTGKFTISLRKELLEPQCTLGPREVCDLLLPLIDGCDEGDARDCLAVGQYLQDGPPLPGFANIFFAAACKIGDAAGCERVAEVMSKDPVPCASDPFRCSFFAARTHDPDLLDEACSLGAASACVMLAWELRADPEIERAYNETACQLGEAAVCAELGRRLMPNCEPSENNPCYAPDPEQARAALEIGCRAGWGDKAKCDALNLP